MDALYSKIKAQIKDEYSSMLVDDENPESHIVNVLSAPQEQSSNFIKIWYLECWKSINTEIHRLTQKPEVSRAFREEIEESKLVAKRYQDHLKFEVDSKHEKLRNLNITYKLLKIQQVNKWEWQKKLLISKINRAIVAADYTWFDTITYQHILDRNQVRTMFG